MTILLIRLQVLFRLRKIIKIIGNPLMIKEEVRFWKMLQERLAFNSWSTLLVDDNAEALAAARVSGIRSPFFKAKSSSRQEAESHPDFPSRESFYELME